MYVKGRLQEYIDAGRSPEGQISEFFCLTCSTFVTAMSTACYSSLFVEHPRVAIVILWSWAQCMPASYGNPEPCILLNVRIEVWM